MKNNKIFLFIDGTNLYAGQFQLFGPDKYINFPAFLREIEKSLRIKFDRIYFYASYSPKSNKPTAREKTYLKNEAVFYRSVKSIQNLTFFRGYRSKTSGQEKEVDVKLTADIISYAFLDKYHEAYLFSGDADFLRALFSIRKSYNKKKLYLLCLQNKLMYQGIFHFKTFIINLVGNKKFKKELKNIEYVEINLEDIVKKI
ncbi:NYN domain-containing protein [Patescibacteria group bacterium]|nr:NYN domain-containing protein [Patescibacteria group bacterium]